MPLIHTETIKVSFSEDEIIKCLQQYIVNKNYELKYHNYDLTSAVFSVDDNGNYDCCITYEKIHKRTEVIED